MAIQLTIPDLGDFDDVEVIEVLVAPGDTVAVEDALITLETDKAAMDVPASHAGTIASIEVKVGDTVSTGDVVAIVEASEQTAAAEPAAAAAPSQTQTMAAGEIQAEVITRHDEHRLLGDGALHEGGGAHVQNAYVVFEFVGFATNRGLLGGGLSVGGLRPPTDSYIPILRMGSMAVRRR